MVTIEKSKHTRLDGIILFETCRLMSNFVVFKEQLNYSTNITKTLMVFFSNKIGSQSFGPLHYADTDGLVRIVFYCISHRGGIKNLKPQLLRDAAGQHVVFAAPNVTKKNTAQHVPCACAACLGSWSVGGWGLCSMVVEAEFGMKIGMYFGLIYDLLI